MTLVAVLSQQAPILDDPTYKELSKLVGGNWEAHPDADTAVHQHFEFAVEGKVIRGTGTVEVKGKTVLFIHSNLGWDPVLKQVSYVDFHGYDTIYMGHITLRNGSLNYDFNEFANPKKHYAAQCRFTDENHYEFGVGAEVLKMERKGSGSAK
jgi:hypothetical protein